ncbi:MAG: methyltransferase domain-containing protein [Candidatus Peregrinibacteria bacterium]|nr:methyltransferase domain-containing protein [Candidatus Peregrinibacteria bacterium]MDZ4245445.1 methyltransferase domain-containing protein [Candidatus Gracilibacteria bacterium]
MNDVGTEIIDEKDVLERVENELAKINAREIKSPAFYNKESHSLPLVAHEKSQLLWRMGHYINKRFNSKGVEKVFKYLAKHFVRIIPRTRRYYVLEDFLQYYDEQFLNNAYKLILGRDPDPKGAKEYLIALRNGTLNRMRILERLRYSKEGKIKKVKIRGLLFKRIMNMVYSLPIIGYIIQIIFVIIKFPIIIRSAERYEAFVGTKFTEYQSDFHELSDKLSRQGDRADLLSEELATKASVQDVYGVKEELATKANIVTSEELKKLEEESHELDNFYLAFENHFRGTRSQIKLRAEEYLPIVREACTGMQDATVVDIGCGRGEWLEILKENGISARGVDLNKIMINECLNRGFDVIEADVIKYFGSLDNKSVGAITGMHIVEHLPFEQIIKLFDEAYRTLKDGGVLILETPNPENLMVGACNFYTDPTHERPIPPLTIQFIAEERGFGKVSIMRLKKDRIAEPPSGMDPLLQGIFYAAPDYALVAYKV